MKRLGRKTVAYSHAGGSKKGYNVKKLSRQGLSFLVIFVFLLNISGFVIVKKINQYQDKKQRTPYALKNEEHINNTFADVHNKKVYDKRDKMPKELVDKLYEQKERQKNGEPQDRTKVKEIEEERSETKRTFVNKDGSKTQEVSLVPTSYKNKDNIWQEIDNTLIKDDLGKWRNKANSWQVKFGDSKEGIELEKNGQTFSMISVDSNDVRPFVSGESPNQTVTYKNLWDGVDVEYIVTSSGVKENIILNKKDVQTNFKFAYNGGSLKQVEGKKGELRLGGDFEGFQIAAPIILNKERGLVKEAGVVEQKLLDGQIVISVDSTWLQSQSINDFPIVIDPTIYPVDVGSTYQSVDSTNFLCDSTTGCGNLIGHDQLSTPSVDWRFAYRVATPTPPGSNDYLASAILHLEMASPPNGITGSEQVKINRSSCLNAFNCFDQGYGEATGNVTTIGNIEVGDLYRKAISLDGINNPWLMVRGEEGGTVDKFKEFDYTKTKVTFTYETLPSQSLIDSSNQNLLIPADNGISTSTQPTLGSTVPTDPDGPGPMRYRYIVGTTKNSPPNNPLKILPSVTGVLADSGLLDSPQWVVPDNVLQDGNTYYWQALVWDGYNTEPKPFVHSPVYSFKVDLRNGKDATQAYDTFGPASVDFATGNVTTSASTHSINALGGSIGLGLEFNSPKRARTGLTAEYWNDPSATRVFPLSPSTHSRIDPNVNFNWGTGSPYTGVVHSDNFLGRWTGWFVAPANGTYQFGTTSDDRSRVYINDVLHADGWSSNPTNLYGSGIALTAGQLVKIKYEFAEWSGNASAQLLAKTTDGTTLPAGPIKSQLLRTDPKPIATPRGLVGRYYTDPGTHVFPSDPLDNTRLFLTRIDTTVNQNWGVNASVPNGPKDNFMVRWKGYFTAPVTDTYTFGVGSDDGARVFINNSSTPTVDAWSDHGASPVVYGSTGTVINQGVSVPITVEYYENTGNAEMGLYVKQASLPSAPDVPVSTDWLSPQAEVLPDGWNFGLDPDGTLSYSFAVINSGGVTLYDSAGQTYEYKYVNGGFVPPVNESGNMVRNGDGTVTLQDEDGQTYIFASDGTIKSVTRPADDRNPSALQYSYSSSNGSPARLTQITDGVTSSRWLKVYYGGDLNCPVVPSGQGFLASNATNMICGVTTSDNRTTGIFYTSDSGGNRLARISLPGDESTDYGYSGGLLSTVRSSLTYDAIIAGVRAQNSSELTNITYDGLGRAISVTLPAATVGATRLEHTYQYLLNNVTQMKVTNATEPNGFNRKVTFDALYRTTVDTDVANLSTTTVWHPTKDLVQSVTDPAGLKSTIMYDYADRITDQYGPAPTAWFDASGIPLTTPTNYTPQVPHNQKIYEEGINGLASAYFEVDTASNGTGSNIKVLFGNPKSHQTGIGPANGDIFKTWGGTPPITPASSKGWGVSLTGWIHLTSNGNHSFRLKSDDGARLWIDDTIITNDWLDGPLRNHAHNTDANGVFNNTQGDKWYRVRVDYYNKSVGNVLDTDAQLELYMTPPGGPETSSLGTLLKPNYGLVTTEKEFDSNANVGDKLVVSNYGSNPELGLLHSSTIDPAGLNLTTNNTYETQGAVGSFLRQTSKTLPGGSVTNYAYYTSTETKDNPCTVPVEAHLQAGMLKLRTEPDPDGAGVQTPITTETIYDDSGRTIASRFNSEAWTCLTYDSRSRLSQKIIAANANGPARTISYNYAVGTNPLVTSIVQNTETVSITTTTDLLGRVISYQDRNNTSVSPTNSSYDNLGRLVSRSGKKGLEEFTYDNFNRLTAQKLDTITLATPTYDTFGRLQQVTYPRANLQKQVISRDSLGRVNSLDYTLGNGSTHHIDSVNYSQSGQVISGTELTRAKSYSYDKASRLTNATIGTSTYSYSYATPSGTTCNQANANLNAHKSSNRTSQTVNGVTTTYCYDQADRLIASSDASLTTPTYDAHGNTQTIGQSANTKYLDFDYDSSDRTTKMHQVFGGGSNAYIMLYDYDATDRMISRSEDNGPAPAIWESFYGYTSSDSTPDYEMDNAWAVRERYIQLVGGALFTVRSSSSSFSSTSNVYTLPNIHGDTMLTTKGSGAITNTFTYEPFGKITSTALPDNSNGKGDYAYVGKHQKQTEILLGNQPQVMGARVYMSVMGRFIQVDPVEGGNANNYIYPGDPVNGYDLNGMWSFKGVYKAVCGTGLWQLSCVPIGGPFVQGAKWGIKGVKTGKAAQVTKNAQQGKAAEDIARQRLIKQYGANRVERNVYYSTPMGKRFADFRILDNSGDPLRLLEVKSGKARYGGSQLKKDQYIEQEYGLPTDLIRIP